MTIREQAHKLVEELPEAQLRPLIELLESRDLADTLDSDEHVATAEEFAAFEAEFGPFLPSDGEG